MKRPALQGRFRQYWPWTPAASHGARVVHSDRGRGIQLARGAREARGDVLWFVHADTLPHPDALADIGAALRDPGVSGGNFRVRFDGPSPGARFLNRMQGVRRLLGWHYGDNTLFVRRGVYEQLGGFLSYSLFEDADLVRRIARVGRFVTLCSAGNSCRKIRSQTRACLSDFRIRGRIHGSR